MGLTFRLGQLPDSLFTDTSNNVGIGAAPSGSYKLEVTGTAKVSSTLLVGSTLTANDGTFSGSGVDGSLGSVVRISTTNTNGNARNWALVNTFDSYGDLNFRISTAQGGNALTAGSTILTLSRTGAATFSSSVSATKVILSGGADQSELTNVTNNDFKLTNSGNFRIVNNLNTIALLTITNIGEASFSSNVQSSQYFRSNTPTTNSVTIGVSANTNYGYIGNSNYWGIRTGTAGDFNIDVNNSTSPINAFKISQGGLVTMTYQPSFYATSTAGSTSYANNEVIVFNTARHNTGSYYNTSNGRFTAPIAGKYLFTINVYAYGGANTGIVLTVNGSQYSITDVTPYVNVASNAVAITDGFTLVWELAAGDYVEPRSRGTSLIYRAHSHFSGQLLS
jgi:hypothetical protein